MSNLAFMGSFWIPWEFGTFLNSFGHNIGPEQIWALLDLGRFGYYLTSGQFFAQIDLGSFASFEQSLGVF